MIQYHYRVGVVVSGSTVLVRMKQDSPIRHLQYSYVLTDKYSVYSEYFVSNTKLPLEDPELSYHTWPVRNNR